MIRIAPYAKAVTAGTGEIVTAGTSIAALLALVPQEYQPVAVAVSVLLGILGVVKTFNVWLVKNEPLFDDFDAAVASAKPVIDEAVEFGRHTAMEIKPAVSSPTVVTPAQGEGFAAGPFSAPSK